MGFTTMSGEPNLYRKGKAFTFKGQPAEVFVGQYVDDCLIAASSTEVLHDFIASLSARFPVNEASSGFISNENPGLLLSMHVRYDIDKGILQFDQRRAIESLAHKYGLDHIHQRKTLPLNPNDDLPKLLAPEKPEFVTEYLSMVGSCLHICQVSRPDCSYAIGVLSRHSATPGEQHMAAARQLMSYMYHSRQWCIQYTRTDSPGNLPKSSSMLKSVLSKNVLLRASHHQRPTHHRLSSTPTSGETVSLGNPLLALLSL